MRACRETTEQRFSLVRREIKGNTPFVAIVRPPEERTVWVRLIVKEWTDVTRGRASGRLNLNHISAEVAKDLTT
jgi:hypothetical protein